MNTKTHQVCGWFVSRLGLLLLSLLTLVALLSPNAVRATDGAWITTTTGGLWDTAANWSGAAPAAGGVTIDWIKQGMTAVEIWVGRGAGFVFLAFDTIPDYTDTQTPPASQSALWKYKDIHRQGDDRVGQWSDVVSIAMAG